MARKKRFGRPVSGILLLDKPTGITSNAALQTVKRCMNAAKAGHTGSLDPLASGMLPLCFGEATKFSQFLLDSDKTYYVKAVLGVVTDSGDADGNIINTSIPNVDESQLLSELEHFRGAIKQVPSMFSALKKDGQPLYKLARQGIEVEREARDIHVHELQLLAFDGDTFSLKVRCSKGTYIRSLVEDIGAALTCGAHVCELRRLSVAHFESEGMVSLSTIEQMKADQAFAEMDALLLDVDAALPDWPTIRLDAASSYYLCQGQAVLVPDALKGWVSIRSDEGKFLGVGMVNDDGKVEPKRLVNL